MVERGKTGQHIDALKSKVINPLLAREFLAIKELTKIFSFLDLGTGDASTSHDLLAYLATQGYGIENIGLLDTDMAIFPELLENTLTSNLPILNQQVVETGRRDLAAEFLQQYEGAYDVALCQLVLHHVVDDAYASYLLYLVEELLKKNGDFFLVNLHPDYLRYLAEFEPDKFVVSREEHDRVYGHYNFDSGGGVEVCGRNVESQVAMLAALGFDLVKGSPIRPDSLIGAKPRYQALADKQIPMLYYLRFRKNPGHLYSSTRGIIMKVKSVKDNWLKIVFTDGQYLHLPKLQQWAAFQPGQHLILHEVHRPEMSGLNILNYWLIGEDERVYGQQLIIDRQADN